MSSAFENFHAVLDSSSLEDMLGNSDHVASWIAQIHGKDAAKSLLFGDALRAKAVELTGSERSTFLSNNYAHLVSVFRKRHQQFSDELTKLRAPWDKIMSTGVPAPNAILKIVLSDDETNDAFLVATTLIHDYDRLVNSFSGMLILDDKAMRHSATEHEEFEHVLAAKANDLAAKVDALEDELRKSQEDLLEKEQDALTMNDQLSKLAAQFEKLAGLQVAKKSVRVPVTIRLERSLSNLMTKLESLESSNVSQKDFEAREKEIVALKAENTKLLENVRDVQADRQRALEESERLLEQLQKLRADKQADGTGKKKKNK